MPVSTNLIPSRQKHSITEAVLSFFLAQPIIKPNKFRDLLLSGQPLHEKFQYFQLDHEITAKIEFQFQNEVKSNFESAAPQENGFTIQSFNDGKIEYVLKYSSSLGQHIFSIHTLQYNRWHDFIENVTYILNSISNFQNNIYAKTIALTYIDQFNWLGPEKLPTDKIFKNDSKYIPMMVHESIGDWNYIFGHTIQSSNNAVYEQINIITNSITEQNKLITISHNVAKGFNENEIELTEVNISEKIVPDANNLHALNKIFFKACLQNEILNMVNINK